MKSRLIFVTPAPEAEAPPAPPTFAERLAADFATQYPTPEGDS